MAIDGKTSRRSKAKGSDPLHLVSAWASRQRLVLGQEAVAEKSNEINAIPLLLERLELAGALVTIDAMGCQTEIAKAIRGKGADYLLALKDNWPALAEEVRRYFDTAPAGALATHETTDGDHGRIEVRRAFVSHDVGLARLRPALPGRVALPGPRDDRHGRGRGRARRQDQHRPPLLSLLRPALRPAPSPPPCAPTGASRTGCTG